LFRRILPPVRQFRPLFQKDTAMHDRELTLANLLTDPLTLAMMAADRVDPVEMKAAWTALARRPALRQVAEPRPVCVEWTCRPW